jgi:hypothetical protein
MLGAISLWKAYNNDAAPAKIFNKCGPVSPPLHHRECQNIKNKNKTENKFLNKYFVLYVANCKNYVHFFVM